MYTIFGDTTCPVNLKTRHCQVIKHLSEKSHKKGGKLGKLVVSGKLRKVSLTIWVEHFFR